MIFHAKVGKSGIMYISAFILYCNMIFLTLQFSVTIKLFSYWTLMKGFRVLTNCLLIPFTSQSWVKGIYLSKATCMIVSLYKQELLFLSRRRIPFATLLYEHIIHLTLITLKPNVQLLSNRQHAYHFISLFRVTSWFNTVCDIVTRWVNFKENYLHEHELQLSGY